MNTFVFKESHNGKIWNGKQQIFRRNIKNEDNFKKKEKDIKKKSTNEEIKEMIAQRLDLGQKRYNQDVPMEDNRDYTQEALEELLDGCVYLAAEILRYKNNCKKG